MKGDTSMAMQTDETKKETQTQTTIDEQIMKIIRLGKQRRQNISRKMKAGKMVKDFK